MMRCTTCDCKLPKKAHNTEKLLIKMIWNGRYQTKQSVLLQPHTYNEKRQSKLTEKSSTFVLLSSTYLSVVCKCIFVKMKFPIEKKKLFAIKFVALLSSLCLFDTRRLHEIGMIKSHTINYIEKLPERPIKAKTI